MPALVGATSVAMLLHFGPYLNQSIAAEAAPTSLPDRITRVGADPAALPRGISEAAERRYTRAAREIYLAAVAVKAPKQNGRRSAMKVGEPAWQSRSRPQHVPKASCHAGLAGSFFPWVFRVNAKPQPDLQPFALSVGV